MNGMRVILTAVISMNVAACLTPRPPVAPPARFAEGAGGAKASPTDAAIASPPVAPPVRCAERPDEAKASPSVATIGKGERIIDARRWVHAAYLNRVKERVRDYWHPANEYRSHDPEGTLYSGQILITRLQVYLRADGSLDRVAIDCSSGLDFLDNLAVEAFEKALPFVNPPSGMVGDTGLINFGFGFAFDTIRVAAIVRDAGPQQ
jgi:outer membrane biosynthesis protein TonB